MRTGRRVRIAMGMAAAVLLGMVACSSTRRLKTMPDGGGGGGCAPAAQISCTRGGPVSPGGPVWCTDVLEPGICVNGQWKCPDGTAQNLHCNCMGVGISACGVCTLQGWACPDAGSPDTGSGDARSDSGSGDARSDSGSGDARSDSGNVDAGSGDAGSPCGPNPGMYCVSGSGSPGAVVCDDVADPQICGADGGWICAAGRIPTSSCNCFFPPFCPGCSGPFNCPATCGLHGWICPGLPDAATPDAPFVDGQ